MSKKLKARIEEYAELRVRIHYLDGGAGDPEDVRDEARAFAARLSRDDVKEEIEDMKAILDLEVA